MMITRRRYFSFLGVLPLLTRCASSSGGTVPFAQMQAYAQDLIDAMSAAAQVYVASAAATQVELVKQLIADLQALKPVIATIQPDTDVRSSLLQVIVSVQQLMPLLEPFLGPAGPAVPLALAVLQAFVLALPAPTNAPPTPPAALHAKALQFHQKNR